MRLARRFLVLLALGCAAAFCVLAGSAFASWITVIDHRAVAMGVPARATIDAPEPVEQRPRLLDDNECRGP